MDQLRATFTAAPPSVVFIDAGTLLAPVPTGPLRKAAGRRRRILVDASHTLGLIAGGCFPICCRGVRPSAGEHAQDLPRPQKGSLHFRRWRFGESVCGALSRGFVSSRHTHHALALYVAMLEMRAFGRAYAHQAVANAVALGNELEKRGFQLLRAGDALTRSNVLLVAQAGALDAYQACERILQCGVMSNARPLYGCAWHPAARHARVDAAGDAAREPAMLWIADLFHRALVRRQSTTVLRREVAAFCTYPNWQYYRFDQPLGFWR